MELGNERALYWHTLWCGENPADSALELTASEIGNTVYMADRPRLVCNEGGPVQEDIKEKIFYGLLEKDFGARTKAQILARQIGIELMMSPDRTGDLLSEEQRLCTQYNVGRSILREAVKILVGKGMLSVRRGIGTRIEARQSWSVFDPEMLGWQLSVADDVFWRDVNEARLIAESSAVRLAAKRASDDHITLLLQAVQVMSENAEAVETVIAARALFHSTILKSTGNEMLEGMTALVFANLVFHLNLQPGRAEGRTLINQYQLVFEAIRQRRSDQAEEAMHRLLTLR